MTNIHVHIFWQTFSCYILYTYTHFFLEGFFCYLLTNTYVLKNTFTLPIQTLCKALHAIYTYYARHFYAIYIYSYFARHFIQHFARHFIQHFARPFIQHFARHFMLHIYIHTYYRRVFSCYLSARHSSWGNKLWILVKKTPQTYSNTHASFTFKIGNLDS